MKFEFDTNNDGATEAAALVTALAILHGDKVVDAIEKASDKLEIRQSVHVPDNFDPSKLANDGRPDTAEPSAADAFGDAGEIITASVGTADDPRPRDKDGIPWDELIHASTKTTNKDGTWTRRRNTPDEVFDKRMAELKGETPPSPPAPPVGASDSSGSTVPAPPPPATSTTQGEADPPPPPRAGTAPTFALTVVKITHAQGAGKITKADVEGYLSQFGMTAMKDLAQADVETLIGFNAVIDGHVGE